LLIVFFGISKYVISKRFTINLYFIYLKSQGYLQNLVSDDRLQNIIDTVDTISIRHEHDELLSDRDIHSVIDDIGTLFDDNAKNVFGTKSSLSQQFR
jgi:hypothetical protein